MLTLFTNITQQLTNKEKNILVPMLLSILSQTSSDHHITGKQLSVYFSAQGHSVSGVRIRKMINYIRVTNAAKPYVVIGAGNGYFITITIAVIDKQIESIKGRIDAMKAFLDTMEAQKQSLKLNAS